MVTDALFFQNVVKCKQYKHLSKKKKKILFIFFFFFVLSVLDCGGRLFFFFSCIWLIGVNVFTAANKLIFFAI